MIVDNIIGTTHVTDSRTELGSAEAIRVTLMCELAPQAILLCTPPLHCGHIALGANTPTPPHVARVPLQIGG